MNDLSITSVKPNYSISFHKEDKTVGILDFDGPELVFNGDCHESAKVFIDFVAQSFANRLKEERNSAFEEAAKQVDHIQKYGGGTLGDEIRALKQETNK